MPTTSFIADALANMSCLTLEHPVACLLRTTLLQSLTTSTPA